MGWVRLSHEYPCETCGGPVHRWVRLTTKGGRIAEATFCPVCFPEVKAGVDIPETDLCGTDGPSSAHNPSEPGQETIDLC